MDEHSPAMREPSGQTPEPGLDPQLGPRPGLGPVTVPVMPEGQSVGGVDGGTDGPRPVDDNRQGDDQETGGRLQRLLRIILLLSSTNQPWQRDELAEELGTSHRTLYRDISELRGAGFEIESHRQVGYSLERPLFIQPVEFTLPESLALLSVGLTGLVNNGTPQTLTAMLALQKLSGCLPRAIGAQLGDLATAIEIKPPPQAPTDGILDLCEKLRKAVQSRTVVECQYDGGSSPEDTFEFHPYSLLFCHRDWYIVGLHMARGQLRTLKLRRFTQLVNTARSFDLPADYSLKDYLGNAWRMMRGDTRYDVELLFTSRFADTIDETIWHHTQQTEFSDDRSLRFTCTVDGLDEIKWWVLSMGPECRVIRPAELAEAVAELARQTVRQYEPRPA